MVRVRAVLSMALDQAERRGAVVRNVATLTTTPAGPKRGGVLAYLGGGSSR